MTPTEKILLAFWEATPDQIRERLAALAEEQRVLRIYLQVAILRSE